MSEFGRTVFSGSPLIRWTLGPACALCAVLFGLCAYGAVRSAMAGEGVVPALAFVALTVTCLAACVAIVFPRCSWAGRLVTGIIALAYIWYVVDEWLLHPDDGPRFTWSRAESTPVNALLGLVVIGLPCLWYTVLGRFTWRKEEEEFVDDDEDFEDGEEPYDEQERDGNQLRQTRQ